MYVYMRIFKTFLSFAQILYLLQVFYLCLGFTCVETKTKI